MNIALVVEMTLGRRMRNAREQMHRVGWLFRVVGIGYLAWAVSAYDAGLFVISLLFLSMPEVIGVMRHLQGRKYGPVYTYTLTDEGIRVTSAISTLEFTWEAVKGVRERGGGWTVRMPGGASTTLPKDSFTPEQDAEWRAFLAGRELVRG